MEESVKCQLDKMNSQIQQLSSLYHEASYQSGISDGELWVWYSLLILKGKYSQMEISEMWSLPKQTVNSIISNMVKKGYIFLESTSEKRNAKVIILTDKGREYGQKKLMWIFDAEHKSLQQMSYNERETCIILLGKYISLLKGALHDGQQ